MSVYSINSFVEHLAVLAADVLLAEHKALKRAAEVVEREAKSEFGVYQGATGPFAKWEELSDYTKQDRVSQGFTENDPLLRSGGLRDSISHAVQGLSAVIGSTDQVMVYQELGTDEIPPRPVLGPALLRKDKEVVRIVGEYTMAAMLTGSNFQYLPKVTGP